MHIYLNQNEPAADFPLEKSRNHPYKSALHEGRNYYKGGEGRIETSGMWKAGRLGLVIFGRLACVFSLGILTWKCEAFNKWFSNKREEWNTGKQRVKYYFLEQTSEALHEEHAGLHQGRSIPPLFEYHKIADGNSVASMEGIAVLAEYLSVKRNVEGLYVCKNLRAFQEKLEQLKVSTGDVRLAFVVTTHGSYDRNKKLEDNNQHKVCVAFERKDNQIKIAILETFSFYPNKEINPRNVNLIESDSYNEKELICSYIQAANFPENQATVYVSSVTRQYGSGCSVYALKDGIAFLEDPNFFNAINTSIAERGTPNNPFTITRLPPRFMKPTQSLEGIVRYLRETPDPGLEQGIVRHFIKRRNKMIDNRVYKYKLYLLRSLRTKSDAEIEALIGKRLIKNS